ncbi:MAG: ABC transporter ATP-binding protein [Pseudomonadota bacterium]
MPSSSSYKHSSGALTPEEIDQDLVAVATDLGVSLPKGRGLRRLWGERHWALRHVNFSVKRGETIGVMGRNGSGKSTLLRTLAGIIMHDEGGLRFAANLDRMILAPGAGFDSELTGRENLFASALLQGHLPDVVRPRVDDIIAFSELGTWADQPVGIYSAGMRTRLGFALSLFLPSDMLMIDETLSAGDAVFRDKAKEAILSLASSGRTVIIVSHNPEMIQTMCTRGLVLDAGKQIACGSIDEIVLEYRNQTMSPLQQRKAKLNGDRNNKQDDHVFEYLDMDSTSSTLARKAEDARILQREAQMDWLKSERVLDDASTDLIAVQQDFIAYLRKHSADKETLELSDLESKFREASEAEAAARSERDVLKKAYAVERDNFDRLRSDMNASKSSEPASLPQGKDTEESSSETAVRHAGGRSR